MEQDILSPMVLCDLVFVLDSYIHTATPYARGADNRIAAINDIKNLDYLKKDRKECFKKFLDEHFYDYVSHYNRLPKLEVKTLVKNLEDKMKLKFFYRNLNTPIEFGTYLQLEGLIYDIELTGKITPETYLSMFFYFFDPVHQVYRQIDPYQISETTAYILDDKEVSEREEKLQGIIRQSKGEDAFVQKKNIRRKNTFKKFYFLKFPENLSEILPLYVQNYLHIWTPDQIYSNLTKFKNFLPSNLMQFFNSIFRKGPAITISMYADESEEKYQIKGKIEIVYAKKQRDLDPESWKNKFSSSHKLAGFSPRKLDRYENFIDVSENGQVVYRNPIEEKMLLNKVRIPFTHKRSTGEFFFTKRFLKKFSFNYLPNLKKRKVLLRLHENLTPIIEYTYKASFKIETSSEIDWFEGKIEIPGVKKEEQKAILQAYHQKEEVFKLSGGKWILLDSLNINNIFEALEELGIRLSKKGTSSLFNKGQLVGLGSFDDFTIKSEAKIKKLQQIFKNPFDNPDIASFSVSSSLNKVLRSYQKDGASFLYRLFQLKSGGILADDMGLGKTLQALAFVESVLMKSKNKNENSFLVICPLAALSVWEAECSKFTPKIKTQLWHGNLRRKKKLLPNGLIITTYATLVQDAYLLKEKRFTAVFIDEAQNAKNIDTKGSKAIRMLDSDSFFCLTGTPVENYLGDLWGLMDICMPGLLGTNTSFKKYYGSGQKIKNIDKLLKKIDPFILRRKKNLVLKELPEKTITTIKLPLQHSQAILYDKIRNEALSKLETAGSDYLMIMLPYLMKLRRICCHPNLGQDKEVDPLTSNKFSYLKDRIYDIQESSSGVLVFSQFTDVLKMGILLLKSLGIDFFYLDGSTTTSQRKEIVDRFQKGEKHFFLISLKAGGTALTLHRADTIFHLDPWWNPAAENQATDRAHRIGQTKNVFAYKLIAKDTIEEKVLKLQNKKKKLFDSLFDSANTTTGRTVSRQELLDILQ